MKTNYEIAQRVTKTQWKTLASKIFHVGGDWGHSFVSPSFQVEKRNESCDFVHMLLPIKYDFSPQLIEVAAVLHLSFGKMPYMENVAIPLEAFDYMVELKLIEL